jgi:hypothetical protein
MENTLKETLLNVQAAAVEVFKNLDKTFDEAKGTYLRAKQNRAAQKLIVDQNARALKAFEPRKPRAKKNPEKS